VKSKGFGAPRTEGEENGEWIIVDCGAAVVHLMQPAIREYYHLEEIWGGKPVRMKFDSADVNPRRTAGPDLPPPPVKKVASKVSKAAKASKASMPEPEPAPRKTAARKAPMKTAARKVAKAPVRQGVTRAVGSKSTPAPRKAPARNAPAKKATTTTRQRKA
jgi:ribosome-associated protein